MRIQDAASDEVHPGTSGGAMPQSRRNLLTIFVGAAGVLAAQPLLMSALPGQGRTPQPIPSPNAPNPNYPPGLNGPDLSPPKDKNAVDPKKQQEIKTDIEKLYELVSELREQATKADWNSTMPVSVIKQAQQIEKLAKHIKELSKG
jgi:hypothetical protein